jgi:carboxylesterase type B
LLILAKYTDHQEGYIFALAQFASNFSAANASAYSVFIQDNLGPAASLVAKSYPLSRLNASSLPVPTAISTIITDAAYKCPAYRGLSRALQNNIPVWAYEFQHTSSCTWLGTLPQEALSLVGATHTGEIPFVFGNLQNQPVPNGSCNATAQELGISRSLQDAWTAMAANADPSTAAVTWPLYSNSSMNRSTPQGLVVVN